RIIASSHNLIIANSPTCSARTRKSPPKAEIPPHNAIAFWQFAFFLSFFFTTESQRTQSISFF
ncbi:MAG: hypothetical protein ACQESZ_06210, partial [Bacteroidota bacterium]